MVFGIDEVLADRWWSAAGCRPVTVSDATARFLLDTVLERRGPLWDRQVARALAGLLTGLEPGEETGVDVGELSRACLVEPAVADFVLARLRHAGLLRLGHAAVDRSGRRAGRTWRLSPGVLVGGRDARAWTVLPAHDAATGRLELHAERAARVA